MGLTGEIAAIRDGQGDPDRLVGEFRRAALLVPLADGPDDGLMSAVSGGIRWVYAFTDEEAMARFAAARGELEERAWPYVSMLGARLVDVVVPEAQGPAGVVVNVADGAGSMFFPPVAGIVPDVSAVDVDRGEAA
ncbi:SseB family protein [Streptomyces sp. ISL-66]|nr:SseB family protein [Streptomyces sp. ISL-66]